LLKQELTPLWKGRFERIEEMMSHEQNYKTYRAALHSCDPPTTPYLGVYLTDLTFIEEGNKNVLERGLVNFDKCYLIAAVIGEIQQYQRMGYAHISTVKEIQVCSIAVVVVVVVLDSDCVCATVGLAQANRRRCRGRAVRVVDEGRAS
jgi:hypothetical protein